MDYSKYACCCIGKVYCVDNAGVRDMALGSIPDNGFDGG
jgi:hypothetical protein